jgi:hypothetical protein
MGRGGIMFSKQDILYLCACLFVVVTSCYISSCSTIPATGFNQASGEATNDYIVKGTPFSAPYDAVELTDAFYNSDTREWVLPTKEGRSIQFSVDDARPVWIDAELFDVQYIFSYPDRVIVGDNTKLLSRWFYRVNDSE